MMVYVLGILGLLVILLSVGYVIQATKRKIPKIRPLIGVFVGVALICAGFIAQWKFEYDKKADMDRRFNNITEEQRDTLLDNLQID
jgi:cytochrome c biogenesis protein CcdA